MHFYGLLILLCVAFFIYIECYTVIYNIIFHREEDVVSVVKVISEGRMILVRHDVI